MHGGRLPVGGAHPGFKTGAHSKYLPTGLATKYAESLGDAELLELRADVALLQARLFQLLEANESLPLLQQAQAAFTDLERALLKQDAPRTTQALKELKLLLQRGVADHHRWREIYEVLEGMGRTKEREHKRLVAMQQMISAEQFGTFILVITDAAKRTIKDPQSLSAFADELAKLWNAEEKKGH